MSMLLKLSAFSLALLAGAAQAGPIGIGGFSGSETVTTFNNLNLPFSNNGALVLNGNTVTTDTGSYRYTQPNGFDADCNGECIGNDTDLGWFDVVLGGPTSRAGARVGGSATSYAGIVDFFDMANNLLGSVSFGNNAGMVFVGWEDLSVGIGRVRFTDTASNGRILHLDDFRFEAANAVPLPGTLALAGLALLGMGFVRRSQKA